MSDAEGEDQIGKLRLMVIDDGSPVSAKTRNIRRLHSSSIMVAVLVMTAEAERDCNTSLE